MNRVKVIAGSRIGTLKDGGRTLINPLLRKLQQRCTRYMALPNGTRYTVLNGLIPYFHVNQFLCRDNLFKLVKVEIEDFGIEAGEGVISGLTPM